MHFRRPLRQTLPTVATVFAAACFLALNAQSAFAQSSSSGSSGSSLLGSSSGIGTGSGSGSGASSGSLLGSTGVSGGSLLGGTGNSSLTGNSLSGSTTATNFRPSTNGQVGPSASNIIAPYYANPLQAGLPNSTTTTGGTANNKQFGSPLFDTLNTSNNTASVSRSSNSSSGLASVAPTNTIRVGPRYTQSLAWQMPPMVASRVQPQLQSVISGSQRLVNPRNIQVSVDGQTVVLRGTAADEHDRALAAAIIGMSPGVYDVRNEIKIQTPVVTPAGATPAGARPFAGPQ